jgi:hypothetical protein
MLISDIVRVATPVQRTFANWKEDYDWMAEYQRVAKLDSPISLDDLAADLGIERKKVGAAIQGGRKLTDSWPQLRRRILRTNSEVAAKFESYGPSRLPDSG